MPTDCAIVSDMATYTVPEPLKLGRKIRTAVVWVVALYFVVCGMYANLVALTMYLEKTRSAR
jgi:hypothetical protein